MSILTGTSFYVENPIDEYWNTGMGKWVVETRPINVAESDLYDWQKTDNYVKKT